MPGDGRTPTVLLVDDDEMDRFLVRLALDRAGYAVVETDDGERALELAAASPPDVLVVDCLMPGMSGLELCERVRSTRALAGTAVVMLTGLDDPDVAGRAQAAGADRVVAKSANPVGLLAAVAAVAAGRR